MNERKDAFTKRPLDFDKEEATRKLETTKWLESHFGSDSHSSRDSNDGEVDTSQFEQEPTKRSYFNVTIKSNPNPGNNGDYPIKTSTPVSSGSRYQNGHSKIASHHMQSQKLLSPAKVHIPEREPPPPPQPPPTKFFHGVSNWNDRKESAPKVFSNKAFHDELKGTVERKKLGKNGNKYVIPRDDEPSDESVKQYGRSSDLGYNSGSRNDLRYRKQAYEEEDRPYRGRPINGVKHESSHDRRTSKEDLRFRSMSNLNSREERDDSAYVSSSTYFTSASPKSPKFLSNNQNIYRSESPEPQDIRPVVPQRKRAMERKMKMINNSEMRSRSPSPLSIKTASTTNLHQKSLSYQPNGYNTLQTPGSRKAHQRTRFASEERAAAPQPPAAANQPGSGKNKIGSAIGNSIRKLVGKIRSASAERKLKLKASQKSKTPTAKTESTMSTYQPYNNNIDHIDDHPSSNSIGVGGGINDHKPLTHAKSLDSGKALLTRQPYNSSSTAETINGHGDQFYHGDQSNGSEIIYGDQNNMIHSPKQRYYLGEDPYSRSIYGRENKYDINSVRSQANRINRNINPPTIKDDLYNNSNNSR